jgi:hypothetical protein
MFALFQCIKLSVSAVLQRREGSRQRRYSLCLRDTDDNHSLNRGRGRRQRPPAGRPRCHVLSTFSRRRTLARSAAERMRHVSYPLGWRHAMCVQIQLRRDMHCHASNGSRKSFGLEARHVENTVAHATRLLNGIRKSGKIWMRDMHCHARRCAVRREHVLLLLQDCRDLTG